MRLNVQQIDHIRGELGADPIPEEHRVMRELVAVFGEHTFYLDEGGLVVWEWVEGPQAKRQPVVAVKLARWIDDDKTSLAVHDPVVTDMIVNLAGGDPVHLS